VGRDHYLLLSRHLLPAGSPWLDVVGAPAIVPRNCLRIAPASMWQCGLLPLRECILPADAARYVVVERRTVVNCRPRPRRLSSTSRVGWQHEFLFKDGQFFPEDAGRAWCGCRSRPARSPRLSRRRNLVWFEEVEYFECDNMYFRKTAGRLQSCPSPGKIDWSLDNPVEPRSPVFRSVGAGVNTSAADGVRQL